MGHSKSSLAKPVITLLNCLQVMTLTGIVQGYGGLVAARTMLGATEAGFFPAASYLLTTWYARFEVQTRLSIFYSAASFAAAFSGLLAFGIQHMDGIAGLGGWRWIFILEGMLTVVIGVFVPWMLPDSPETASFLTEEEKAFIIRRLQQDAGTAAGKVQTNEGYKWSSLKAALTDWKIYVFVLIFWGNSVCNVGFLFTVPTIILELGYSAANAQLLTVPIFVVGLISTLTFSFLADRSQTRWQFIIIPFCIALVGYIGLISIPHPALPGLTYAFLFFIPAGVYPPLIGATSWVANNLAPTWKRATGMALFISLGNLIGAVGSNIFLEEQAPHYWLGYGFGIGAIVVAISAALVLKITYTRLNKQRDLISVEEVRARYTEGESSPVLIRVKVSIREHTLTCRQRNYLKWAISPRCTDTSHEGSILWLFPTYSVLLKAGGCPCVQQDAPCLIQSCNFSSIDPTLFLHASESIRGEEELHYWRHRDRKLFYTTRSGMIVAPHLSYRRCMIMNAPS